jgi:hypothetical protein
MAKSEKSTIELRIAEITRLLFAGGEFEDIRQYASAQGWNVCDRQLRRYQERAYSRLAKICERDRKQLMGRHLSQRRALYARAIKQSDIRTAAHILKDEGMLQGLYPRFGPGGQVETSLLGPRPPISRKERFYRMLKAEAAGDKKELRLMEHLSPDGLYRFSDMCFPRQMLHILALMHVAEMLDYAGMLMMAMWRMGRDGEATGTWSIIGSCHAQRFRIQQDAWDKFTEELGVDGDQLVRDNHQGSLLELFTDQVYELATPQEEFMEILRANGGNPEKWPTVEGQVRWWKELLEEVLGD